MRLGEITWLSADEANYRARWIQYIGDSIYPVSIGASKLALLSLYWRLFGVSGPYLVPSSQEDSERRTS